MKSDEMKGRNLSLNDVIHALKEVLGPMQAINAGQVALQGALASRGCDVY